MAYTLQLSIWEYPIHGEWLHKLCDRTGKSLHYAPLFLRTGGTVNIGIIRHIWMQWIIVGTCNSQELYKVKLSTI